MPGVKQHGEQGRNSAASAELARMPTPNDHEQNSNHDLEITINGRQPSIELRELSCPYCREGGVSINIDLTAENRKLVVQRPWNSRVIREMAASAVAVIFVMLAMSERNQKVLMPILILIAVYYFSVRSSKASK